MGIDQRNSRARQTLAAILGERERPRMRDAVPIASSIAFMWQRIKPQTFSESTLRAALDLVVRNQNAAMVVGQCGRTHASPCLMSTCELHALALNRPTGWERAAVEPIEWLWTQQEDIGCWTIPGGPTVWLTVLALDSIKLAEGVRVTFNLQEQQSEREARGPVQGDA